MADHDEDDRPNDATDEGAASLESRDEGAHAEYADAPASLADEETETQERQEDGADGSDAQRPRHAPEGEPDAESDHA